MAQDGPRRFNWAGLPLVATVARVLCRELTLQNEYLQAGESHPEVEGQASAPLRANVCGAALALPRWH